MPQKNVYFCSVSDLWGTWHSLKNNVVLAAEMDIEERRNEFRKFIAVRIKFCIETNMREDEATEKFSLPNALGAYNIIW